LSEDKDSSLPDDASFLEAAERLYGLPPFGYTTTTGSGAILIINNTLLNWLGYRRQELQAKTRLVDLLTAGGRIFYETHLAPILMSDGSADEVALDFISKDATVIPTLVSARQTRDERNGCVLNRWTIFKATERRRYERELVSARKLFETTLSSIGDAVVTTDASATVVFLNYVAADLSGWDPDLAAGRPIDEVLVLVQEDTAEPIEHPIRKALRTKASVGLANHTVLVSKDGRRFVIDDSAAPISDEDGQIFGAVMVFRDITKRREAERALKDAYQQLQDKATELRRSNEDLSEFAYVASHDLRSPLKTVAMYSQLLQRRYRDKLGPEGTELLTEIENATKRLTALIEDLLAFSTSGKRDFSLKPIDADTVLDIVRGNLHAMIAESEASVDSGPLPRLGMDTTSLIQLLQNLVANAIRYRSAAPPRISISAAREAEYWHFRCSDNGVGIPSQYYERIFEPFKRLHGQEIPGSGIGLALCRKIVERYGGHIWVESTVGKGSTFHFTLPVADDSGDALTGKE
jgi:PAS domain S-box-containing protein